jgi:hypothetical protein
MRRAILVSVMLGLSVVSARADRLCVVADPSGTPLNVRSAPYGRILGALNNGAPVRLLDTSRDDGGRPWAYVAPRGAGKAGWVYREYIECE